MYAYLLVDSIIQKKVQCRHVCVAGYAVSVDIYFANPVTVYGSSEMSCAWGEHTGDKTVYWYRALYDRFGNKGKTDMLMTYYYVNGTGSFSIEPTFTHKVHVEPDYALDPSMQKMKMLDLLPEDKGIYFCVVDVASVRHPSSSFTMLIIDGKC